MDQITTVERELLALGVPAGIHADELRRLAKDILWQALEMKSAQALAAPLGNIQAAFEVPYNHVDCDRAAAAIWDIAHAGPALEAD
jgi:hypothetical protein